MSYPPQYSTDAEAERDALVQLLAVAGVDVDDRTVAIWSDQQRLDARSWALDQIAAFRTLRTIVRPPHVADADRRGFEKRTL